MKLFDTIALFAGFAAAAPALTPRDGPSGHEVKIAGFTYGGSGCPSGTVGSMLSSDLTTLTLIYDKFIAQAGPGLQPKDYRENCQTNVKLQYPQGWQFSVFKADYRGHVTLPENDTGTVKANYYFSGSSEQVGLLKTYLAVEGFSFSNHQPDLKEQGLQGAHRRRLPQE